MEYDVKNLTTVRIMAISLKVVDSNEILVVSTLNGAKDDMQKIRIYLKSEAWDFKTLEIATDFYKQLVKYRLLLKKKVYDKHLYQSYNDIKLLHATQDLPFASVRQLYIANLKAPTAVLKKPRSGYKEVKSDTYRLWARDEMIRIEKERLKAIKESKNGWH